MENRNSASGRASAFVLILLASITVTASLAAPVENGLAAASSISSATSGGSAESGFVEHKVQHGDTLWDISRKYGVSVEDIVTANAIKNANLIREGQTLRIPSATVPAAGEDRRRIELASRGRLSSQLAFPLRARISSRFGTRWGRLHEGVDFAAPTGTPVRAAAAGVVSYSGWARGYGRLIVVDHGNGVTTYYAHNSQNLVGVGQRVVTGATIAAVGATGDATGPNLHFEVRIDGEAYDPLLFLP